MDPRLQAGVELQLEKQARQAHNSSLSGVLGQYFKQGADDDFKTEDLGKVITSGPADRVQAAEADKANRLRAAQEAQERAQQRSDEADNAPDPVITGPTDRVQAAEASQANRLRAAQEAQERAQYEADNAPHPMSTGPTDRVQAAEADKANRLRAAQEAQERAQYEADNPQDTITSDSVSERDKLMASLPPHLREQPEPGTPEWDYWNKMVQLHIKRQNKNRTNWGKRP